MSAMQEHCMDFKWVEGGKVKGDSIYYNTKRKTDASELVVSKI